jgi:hypothetical protein
VKDCRRIQTSEALDITPKTPISVMALINGEVYWLLLSVWDIHFLGMFTSLESSY